MLTVLRGGLERLSELNNEIGATGVEYGLLVGLIAVVIITAVSALGLDIAALFEEVSAALP